MAKKRVHQIAKERDIPSKDVLAALQNAGLEVTTASSSVDEAEAAKVLGNGASAATEAAPAPKSEAAPAAQADAKPDAQAEATPDAQAEAKPDAQGEAKQKRPGQERPARPQIQRPPSPEGEVKRAGP